MGNQVITPTNTHGRQKKKRKGNEILFLFEQSNLVYLYPNKGRFKKKT